MSLISLTKIRRHTLIVSKDGSSAMLEKDWYSHQWVTSFAVRHVIKTAHGEFHVVANLADFTRREAVMLVDAAIAGKIRTINLREFSRTRHPNNGRK